MLAFYFSKSASIRKSERQTASGSRSVRLICAVLHRSHRLAVMHIKTVSFYT